MLNRCSINTRASSDRANLAEIVKGWGLGWRTSRGRATKSGEGLDCITLTSCRIRFTAGLLRLNFAVAAIAPAAARNPLASSPPAAGPGLAFELGVIKERRSSGSGKRVVAY